MAGQSCGAGVGEHVEAGAQALGHLLQGPPPHPGAGQLQGERDPVEVPAHLRRESGPFGGVEGGRGVRGRGQGAGAQQGEGVAVGALAGQRADLDDVLAGAVERLAGGDQDGQARGGLEEFADQVAAVGHHVLAGVEDEEELLVRHPGAQLLVERAREVAGEADGMGHGHREQ